MEPNTENKPDTKNKLLVFYTRNKIKVNLLIFIVIAILIAITILKINNIKKDNIIAEKYVTAVLSLSSENKENSRLLYEEIILSKNKFYSILALNTMIEKNLTTDTKQILNYFETIEKIIKSQEQIDLLNFKKALYLMKNENFKAGNILLQKLIDENSKLKVLAEEIISK
jgi:hypothetical protein|tara:strand:+ start:79 stop:588 length:510 start_codon:yes stop_codon:yes gene_type:complete